MSAICYNKKGVIKAKLININYYSQVCSYISLDNIVQLGVLKFQVLRIIIIYTHII